jgi:hypothetical protein
MIGATIVLDDGGFKDYGAKWGIIILANFLGMFLGGQWLAFFEMTNKTAVWFMVMGLVSIVASFVGFFSDQDPKERKPLVKKNTIKSDKK